jgi:methylmalonyl-CoA mutase
MIEIKALASGFSEPSEDAWRQAVAESTGGRSPDALAALSDDGITVGPIYRAATDRAPIVGRAPGTAWRIIQRIDDPDPGAANLSILAELAGGAQGVALVFGSSASARGRGIKTGKEGVGRLVDQAGFGDIDVHVDAGAESAAIAAEVLALAAARGTDPRDLTLTIAFDPIAALAARGGLPRPLDAILDELCEAARGLGGDGRALIADGRVWHNAGATEAQELGAAIAAFVGYLRMLEAGGVARETAARQIGFVLAADSNQFITIAKLRALRLLHGRVVAAAGIASVPAHVHVETSWRMLSRHDRHVNLLRTTAAAFAAGVGGANSVTALPFDEPIGSADPHARRIARNSQLVLSEEAGLAHVADPGAGSGAVEALTDALAEKGWAFFRHIEAEGGLADAVRSGSIQAAIAEAATARAARVATLAVPLTGTSQYPDLSEAPLPARPKARDLKAKKGPPPAETAPALAPARLAEPFEALRERAGTMGTPTVFLACIGRKADYAEIANAAANYFGVGGIAAHEHAVAGEDDVAAAFKAVATPLACLCAGPKGMEAAAGAAAVLKAAGAKRIYILGKAGEARAALEAAGVTGFIARGTDAAALLGDALTAFEEGRA